MAKKAPQGISSAGWNVSDMILDKTVTVAKSSVKLSSSTLKGVAVSTSHVASSASDYIIRHSPRITDKSSDLGAHMAKKAFSSSVMMTRATWRIGRGVRRSWHFHRAHKFNAYSFFNSMTPQQQLKYQRKARKELAKVNRTRKTFHLRSQRNLTYHFDYEGVLRVNRESLKVKKEKGTLANVSMNATRRLSNSIYGNQDFGVHTIGVGLRTAWNTRRWGATGIKTIKNTFGLMRSLLSFLFALATGLPATIMSVIGSIPIILVVLVVSLVISIFTVTSGSVSARVDSLALIIEHLQETYSQHIKPVDLLCLSYGLGWTTGGENGEYYENMCRIIYKNRKDEELTLKQQCEILLVENNPAKVENYVKYKYGWDDKIERAKLKALALENQGGKNALEIVNLKKKIDKKDNDFKESVGSVYPSFFEQSVSEGRKAWGSSEHINKMIAEITSKSTYKYNYDAWDKAYGAVYGSATGSSIAMAALTEMNLYHTRWIKQGKSGQHYRDWAKNKFHITVPRDAWCATWTWYVLVNDVKLFKGNEIKAFPSTVAMWNYFEKEKKTHRASSKYIPQQGDLVFWRHASGNGGHVGIVTGKNTFVSGNEADDVRSASISGQKGSGALLGYVSLNTLKGAAGDYDGNLNPLSGDTNELKTWNYLKNRGLSDEAAAAIIGNLTQESRINPYMDNASGTGICSWIGDRRNRMMRNAPKGDWKDLKWQLSFMYSELSQRKHFVSFTTGQSTTNLHRSYYPSSKSDQVTRKTWDFMIMFEYNSIKGFNIAHRKKASNGAPADMFPQRVSYAFETYNIRKGKSDHWKLFN